MPETAYEHILQQSGISPCFNPQKMGTLEFLYLDENNNLVQVTLQKMMVQRRVDRVLCLTLSICYVFCCCQSVSFAGTGGIQSDIAGQS